MPIVSGWNRSTAIVLSFILPGLGQGYKGQIVAAVVWLSIVMMGYFYYPIFGFVSHCLCIQDAFART